MKEAVKKSPLESETELLLVRRKVEEVLDLSKRDDYNPWALVEKLAEVCGYLALISWRLIQDVKSIKDQLDQKKSQ
jgi:hypothetical protein